MEELCLTKFGKLCILRKSYITLHYGKLYILYVLCIFLYVVVSYFLNPVEVVLKLFVLNFPLYSLKLFSIANSFCFWVVSINIYSFKNEN